MPPLTDLADRMDNPVEDLMNRLRTVLPLPGDAAAEAQRVIESFLEQMQLVPRRELDKHLDELTRMQQRIETLEKRLEALEQG